MPARQPAGRRRHSNLALSGKVSRPGLHGARAVSTHTDSMKPAICCQFPIVVAENIVGFRVFDEKLEYLLQAIGVGNRATAGL